MELKIENVNITLNVNAAERELKNDLENMSLQVNEGIIEGMVRKDSKVEEIGMYSKEDAPNGVYILANKGELIQPEFYGMYRGTITPESVAVIDGEHRFIIHKYESEREYELQKEYKSYGKEYSSREEALKYYDGKGNTDALIGMGSEAAEYVRSLGEKFFIPALGQKVIAKKHKEAVDFAMTLIGGMPLKYGWFWTSTQYSSIGAWILHWDDGDVSCNSKNNYRRVRAFAALD